jgi:L-threonylcarbamoyladenylate synthase
LGDEVEIILDGGECDWGIESTIVDCSSGQVVLLRRGGITVEDIEEVVGSVNIGKAVLERPLAPGQLASHYAPNTPLTILQKSELPNLIEGERIGFLAYGEEDPTFNCEEIEYLATDEKDLKAIAHNLFSALHRLDSLGLDALYIYDLPREGIANAIMDRLLKAAARRSK